MNTTKESNRPKCPKRPLDERVNDRLEALLARVDGVKRGSDMHVVFDAAGQQHAASVAMCERVAKHAAQKRAAVE